MSHYVPVLKGKEGEYGALEELPTALRTDIVPLIEIPDVPYDYAGERPARTLDEHIEPIAARLLKCWPNLPFYLDMPWFADSERLADGSVAVARVLSGCQELGLRAVPVVAHGRPVGYLEAVRDYLAAVQGSSYCVRLTTEDFEDDQELPSARVARLQKALGGMDSARGDLMLDLASVGPDLGRAVLVARSVMSEAPTLTQWRSVILAAASFPENLGDLSASTVSPVPRLEWQLWQKLQRRRDTLPRPDMVFGDYGISSPVPTEIDPRVMRMSASIRYTAEAEWLVFKGRNVREYGFDQYFRLAKAVCDSDDYSGEDYSWGDRFIARCARRDVGPGNATTWRKVGTNHHITFVARQLSANGHPVA